MAVKSPIETEENNDPLSGKAGYGYSVYNQGGTDVTVSGGVRTGAGQLAGQVGAQASRTANIGSGGDMLKVSGRVDGYLGMSPGLSGKFNAAYIQQLGDGHSLSLIGNTGVAYDGQATVTALAGSQYRYERPAGSTGSVREASVTAGGGLYNGNPGAYIGGDMRVDVLPEHRLYGVFGTAASTFEGSPRYSAEAGLGKAFDSPLPILGKTIAVEAGPSWDSGGGNTIGADGKGGLAAQKNGLGGFARVKMNF